MINHSDIIASRGFVLFIRDTQGHKKGEYDANGPSVRSSRKDFAVRHSEYFSAPFREQDHGH